MRTTFSITIACLLTLSLSTRQAFAQAAAAAAAEPPAAAPQTPPAPTPPPPPAAAQAPVQQAGTVAPSGAETGTVARAVAPAPAAPGCAPPCRAGYTCVADRCVSSCNPPCGMGEVCTAQAECMRAAEPPASNPYPVAHGDDGSRRHDGFFLRLTLGVGGGAVAFDVPADDDTAFGGGGWASSIDLGGALDDDITFFGRARLAALVSPVVSSDDRELDAASDAFATQSMLGVGISYYIMPLNLYLDGVVGVAWIVSGYDYRGERRDYDSGVGFGFDLDVGKEWWVGDNWGLGIALRLSVTRVESSDDLPSGSELGAVFGAVLFSATYQ